MIQENTAPGELPPSPALLREFIAIAEEEWGHYPPASNGAKWLAAARAALAARPSVPQEPVAWPDVDEFAQHIRWMNGSNKMGAGTLAENLLSWLKSRAAAAPSVEPACAWTADDEGNWDTTCGEKHILIDGSPDDNFMRFCCYCGGVLAGSREPADLNALIDWIRNNYQAHPNLDSLFVAMQASLAGSKP